MLDQEPQTLHYGLVARWWAEFNNRRAGDPLLPILHRERGEPALDAACGTGRLLVPYLRAGLDVDGCDISPDMLARCRENAGKAGVAPKPASPNLARARSAALVPHRNPVRRLRLGGSRALDQEALRRIHEHLYSGGRLVLDKTVPYANADDWRYWLPEERARLPEPWPLSGRRKRAANGDELEIRTRTAAFDPLHQVVTWQLRRCCFKTGGRCSRRSARCSQSCISATSW